LEPADKSGYKGAFAVKMEAAVSCRSTLVLTAALAAVAGAALSDTASARDYKLGCANGACVIVDDTGRITFFAVGNKTLAEGADQLKAPASGRIRPPLNISCSSLPGGDACVVTDADGDIWVGPTRSGTAFGESVARIPVPGPH
jgi:hypothetical protein